MRGTLLFSFVLLSVLVPAAFPACAQAPSGFAAARLPAQQQAEQALLAHPSPEAYRRHLEALTKVPHSAGTPANAQVRAYIAGVMRKAGWHVEQPEYDIYLPVAPGETVVEIAGPVPLRLATTEPADDAFAADAGVTPGWNAYSGSGDVTAEVVYANYGTKEDFEKLREMGVSVAGRIVLARYGGNFRGYKAKHAQAAGAAGLIIYTDPLDGGYMKGIPYPEGPQAGEGYIQRGSLLTLDFTGDPLTPFVPALPRNASQKIARTDPAQVGFHRIPVTPVSYGAAREIIVRMKGRAVPSGWQGGLPAAYRLDGGPGLRVRLKVEQKRDFVRAANVVGTLKGSAAPDEWVLLGCHYDAWVHGATDPNSGTAMLLAVAEALGELARTGRVPRRTVKIGHWDAEEFGVIGSTEWVEQHRDVLAANAVAYLNADAAVSGRVFGAAASPSLKALLTEATRAVPYPGTGQTLYQHWAGGKPQPEVGNLGGGSDHLAFYTHVGVPSLSGGTGGVTPYHSAYDNMAYYSRFVDSTFRMGPMVAQVFGIMALRLANADLVPYDVARYAADLETHAGAVEKSIRAYHPAFTAEPLRLALAELKSAADAYGQACKAALEQGKVDQKNARTLNKALISLEKSFIDAKGMAYGPWYRSLYASPDPYSGYAAWMLPAYQYEASLRSTAGLPELEARHVAAIRLLAARLADLGKRLSAL